MIDDIDSIVDDNTIVNGNAEETTGINYGKVLDMDRDQHGKIDLDASMDRIRAEAEAFIENNEVPVELIAEATLRAFDKLSRKENVDNIKMLSLTNRAVLELDIPLSAETRMIKRITAYVQNESSKFYETEGEVGMWVVGRGRTGGVHLVSDAFRLQYKTKLAKKNDVSLK